MIKKFSFDRHCICLIVLILVSVGLFANTFGNSFVWDDEDIIIGNKYIRSFKYVPFLFNPRYWNEHAGVKGGKYRPVGMLTFVLDYALWKLNPRGYHITNLLLHILNVILVYFLTYELILLSRQRGERLKQAEFLQIPFLTALFFAAHPIHVEAVTWIKNRFELLAALFFILSVFIFIRYKLYKNTRANCPAYFFSLFCFILALFSKSAAITLPFILILCIICFLPRQKYKKAIMSTLPFFGIIVLYVIFEFTVLRVFTANENEYNLGIYAHILTVVKTIGWYLKLIAIPVNLNLGHIFTIPHTFLDREVIFSIILLTPIFIMTVRMYRDKKIFSFSAMWLILSMLPVSNIIFLSGRPIAEQRVYIPSIGFCLLIALVINKLSSLEVSAISKSKTKNLAMIAALITLIFYSTATVRQNAVWKDSLTLWSNTVKNSPQSSRAHNNLGLSYMKLGKYLEAMAAFRKAIEIDTNQANVYNNLGNTYLMSGRREEAVGFYEQAIKIDPNYKKTYNNLGIAYCLLGRHEQATAFYQKAIALDGKYVDAYYNLGNACVDINKPEQAIAAYKRALEIDPDDQIVSQKLAETYAALGQHKAVRK
ncbi:MAG: tetratricopeptide repeat protein [Candidatus Omnitrophota bacterium]